MASKRNPAPPPGKAPGAMGSKRNRPPMIEPPREYDTSPGMQCMECGSSMPVGYTSRLCSYCIQGDDSFYRYPEMYVGYYGKDGAGKSDGDGKSDGEGAGSEGDELNKQLADLREL